MKGLTIRNPWALLIADGVKCIETRSWQTKYRGSLAICAGLQHGSPDQFLWISVFGTDFIKRSRDTLGHIVAVAKLVDVVPTTEIVVNGFVQSREYPLGDYAPGRWGWVLEDIYPVMPERFRGFPGLFTIPTEVETSLVRLSR